MCRYAELEFSHFVIVTSDGTIFGCAKENGHTYNFLIQRDGVRAQHGEQWIDLEPVIAAIVRARAQAAYGAAPIYKTSRLLIN